MVMSAFEKTLSVHLSAEYPHQVGKDEPEKELRYSVQVLLDGDELATRTSEGTHFWGGLLHSSGSTWEEAWKTAFDLLMVIATESKRTLEEIVSVRGTTIEEDRAGHDGYSKGCEVGRNWSFGHEEIAVFSAAVRGTNREIEAGRGLRPHARIVYLTILQKLGVGVSVKTYGKAEDDADAIIEALK